MNSRTLYLVCGLPGAGKTTRARQLVQATNAVYLCVDEWILGLGVSLVDYEFRFKLQNCMLDHAGKILRAGASVVIEFGSWSLEERARIREVARAEGAAAELHFLNAPLDELVRRVRERGGPNAEDLISTVLRPHASRFEAPTSEEIASFDRYFGPEMDWPVGARA